MQKTTEKSLKVMCTSKAKHILAVELLVTGVKNLDLTKINLDCLIIPFQSS